MISNFASEAAEAGHVDGIVYGAIAMAVFILLGFVTWSYRDVANRHDHKSGKASHNSEANH